MSTPKVSPFTFLTWKEDDNAIVAGTSNTSMGYIQLLTIDGIDIDDVVSYAVEKNGEKALSEGLATNFPAYVAEVAAQKGTPCFTTTGKANVEYADMNTGEVAEGSFDATEANYNESVRVDTARAEHTRKTGSGAAAEGEDGENDDDDDDYEDIDDEEEEDGEEHPESEAYMAKRRLLDMISTQLQTAMSIAFDLGLSVEETQAVYKQALPPLHPVPQSLEECHALANGDQATLAFLSQVSPAGGSHPDGDGDHEGPAGMPAGMPEGMPQGMPQGANCPQQ